MRFSFLQKRLTGKDYELPEGVEIKQEKMDNNNGNDEDLDEEVEVVYEEEEEEEDSNEDEECAAEEVQTEHINVTPNKKGKLKAMKQVTAQTTAQRKTAVKTTQDIHCTELESDEEKKTEKLNKKESTFVSGENTAAPFIMELLSDDEMEQTINQFRAVVVWLSW